MGQTRASRIIVTAACCGIAAALSTLPAAGADDSSLKPCTLDPGPVHTVTRVLDGETLVMEDGSAVRLIGALAPRARDAGAEPGAWPPETQSIKTLSDLVLGKKVTLAFGGPHQDRYGRFLAHVFVDDQGRQEWVQGTMLASGQARAYGLPNSFACARELLAHEHEARRARAGLWSNGVYQAMPASRPALLLQQRGKYERVIGSVVAIGKTKSATYLNFGADQRTDFTIRIGKKVLAADPDFAHRVDGMQAARIIVRGWIERRNGPLIDLADASQIEFLDGDGIGSRAPAAVSAMPQPQPDAQPANAPEPLAPDGVGPKKTRPAPTEGAEPGAVNL